jgi:hypothetical protein
VARRTKRRTPTKARRPAGPATAASTPAAASRTAGAREGRVGGDQALVRSVEMSLAPGPPSRRGGRVVLDNADPAIPLDRVPYFLSDLTRLAIVAAVMVVLMFLAAELIVPRVIK